jgi:hypothetical protein
MVMTVGTVGGKAASGAAAVANPVLVGGTDSGGTVYSPLVTTAGAWGSVAGVNVVSNITNGSIVVTAATVAAHAITAATITEGTLRNLISGTINSATAVLNSGTINVATAVITTLPNLPQGSINVTAGTMIMTNGTIGAGTVAISAGTITHGTIDVGTVRINPNPTIHWMPFGTTTTGTIGTLVAAPSAGSAVLLNSLDISCQSGTAEVLVSYGLVTTGNGVVNRGNYVAGGGLSKTYSYPLGGSISGSALTYNILSGSGTISYSIGYAIQVP